MAFRSKHHSLEINDNKDYDDIYFTEKVYCKAVAPRSKSWDINIIININYGKIFAVKFYNQVSYMNNANRIEVKLS